MMSQGLGYEQMAASLGTTQEAIDRTVTELFSAWPCRPRAAARPPSTRLKRLHAAVVQKEAAATAFRSFVPEQVAAKLQASGATELREELEVTILFSDVRGYSTLAERLAPSEVLELVAITSPRWPRSSSARAAWWISSSATRSWRCSAPPSRSRTTPSVRYGARSRCSPGSRS